MIGKDSFWDTDDEDVERDVNHLAAQKLLNEFNFSTEKTIQIFRNKYFNPIKLIFMELNTALPSSGAVERLFSIGKLVLKPNRCLLTDEHFEAQLLLHINKNNINK